MSKFCDKCGAELKNENAKFCDKCGSEIRIAQNNRVLTDIDGIVCPFCGQVTPKNQANCVNCGVQLKEDNLVAVIVGYVLAFLFPLFALIPAIYLLTRDNLKSKTQGIYIIIMVVVFFILFIIFNVGWIRFIIGILMIIVGAVLWVEDYTFLK